MFVKREIFDMDIGGFSLHSTSSDGRSRRCPAIHQSQILTTASAERLRMTLLPLHAGHGGLEPTPILVGLVAGLAIWYLIRLAARTNARSP